MLAIFQFLQPNLFLHFSGNSFCCFCGLWGFGRFLDFSSFCLFLFDSSVFLFLESGIFCTVFVSGQSFSVFSH